MGIYNFYKEIKSALLKPVNLSDYSGLRAAVDIMCWLHKSIVSCGKELCLSLPTTKYINCCMGIINLLLQHEIFPIIVFDGADLPIKDGTNSKRKEKRSLSLKLAHECEARKDFKNAYKYYCSAVDITPDLYIPLIQELINHNISYIIAPYEADAELAYLSLVNLVDLVITEDSDLIAYGCSKILFKLDQKGTGMEFSRQDLFLSSSFSFRNFTEDMILSFCILLGCDFLKNPKGWGWKRLFPLIEQGKTPSQIIDLVCKNACLDNSYKQDFFRAFYTFRYQIIFDPITKSQRPLTKPERSFKLTLYSYLGSIETDQSSALDKARGLVNPISGSKTNLSIPPSYDFFRFISSPKVNSKEKVILQQHVKSAAAALHSKKKPKSSVS